MADVTKTIEIQVDSEGAVKNLKTLDKELENVEEQTKETTKATSDFADEITIFGTNIGGLRRAFNSAIQGTKSFIVSLKTLRGAIIATGIGALIIALTTLGSLFKTNQGFINGVSDAFAVLGAAVNVVINRFSQLGSAFARLIQGDIVGFVNEAADAFRGVTEEIRNATTATLELEQAQRDLEDLQRIARLGNAQDIADIKELVLLSRDRTRSAQERQNAILEAQRLQERVNQRNIDIALQEQELLKERITLASEGRALLDDERDQLIDAQLAVQEARERAADAQRDLVNRQVELQGAVDEERRAQAAFAARAEVDIEIEKQDLIQQEVKRTGIVIEQQLKDNTELARQEAKIQEQIEFEKNQAIANSAANLFGALANLAGQSSQFGKSLAISEALINTYASVTSILRDPSVPTFTKPFLIATALATGFAQVANIRATATPEPPQAVTVVERRAKGGIIEGPSHENGGVKYALGGKIVELEGGEAVINKRATRLFKPILSAINQSTGGIKFQAGGITPVLPSVDPVLQQRQLEDINRAIRTQTPVLVVEDVSTLQNQIAVRETRADLG
jgi:hypothetical protein